MTANRVYSVYLATFAFALTVMGIALLLGDMGLFTGVLKMYLVFMGASLILALWLAALEAWREE